MSYTLIQQRAAIATAINHLQAEMKQENNHGRQDLLDCAEALKTAITSIDLLISFGKLVEVTTNNDPQ